MSRRSKLKKGDLFKLSVRGHNNFFYPGSEVFRAEKDMDCTYVNGWLRFEGLSPVKVATQDLSEALKNVIDGKYSVLWITS